MLGRAAARVAAGIRVAPTSVTISCNTAAIAHGLGCQQIDGAPAELTLEVKASLSRTGMRMKLIQADGSAASAATSQALIKQIVAGRRWWAELRRGEIDIKRLAEREKLSASWITRTVRLAFLSPTVTSAILAGRQRPGADAASLTLGKPLAGSWRSQEAYLLG